LPLFYNIKDGETERKEVEKSKFFETKKELAERFKGCTFTQVQGVWIDKDIEYSDVNMGFYIVAPNTEDSITFFQEYKKTLKQRFDQLDLLITYYPVENL
jgi:hypothetical protein